LYNFCKVVAQFPLDIHGLDALRASTFYTAANWWAKTYRCTPHELMAIFGWLKIEQAMKYTQRYDARTRRPAWWSGSRRAGHDDPREHCQPGCKPGAASTVMWPMSASR
jgi:hypothetical protein